MLASWLFSHWRCFHYIISWLILIRHYWPADTPLRRQPLRHAIDRFSRRDADALRQHSRALLPAPRQPADAIDASHAASHLIDFASRYFYISGQPAPLIAIISADAAIRLRRLRQPLMAPASHYFSHAASFITLRRLCMICSFRHFSLFSASPFSTWLMPIIDTVFDTIDIIIFSLSEKASAALVDFSSEIEIYATWRYMPLPNR